MWFVINRAKLMLFSVFVIVGYCDVYQAIHGQSIPLIIFVKSLYNSVIMSR